MNLNLKKRMYFSVLTVESTVRTQSCVFRAPRLFLYVLYTGHVTHDNVLDLFLTSNQSKKISNDQELIQSDPISCPQNQKGNN